MNTAFFFWTSSSEILERARLLFERLVLLRESLLEAGDIRIRRDPGEIGLAPVFLALAGVTLIVMAGVYIGEGVIEAIRKRDKEKHCDKMQLNCLMHPWQPDWNRKDYGPKKECGDCYSECMKDKRGRWPEYKCPSTN